MPHKRTHPPASPLFRAARLGLALALLVTVLVVRPGRPAQASLPPETGPAATQVDAAFGQLPLYFIENHGQVDRRAAYYVQGRDKAIYFAADGVWYAFSGEAARYWLRLDFLGAQPVRPLGQDRTPAIVSYFKGAPGEWQAGLPTFAGVLYRDLWPGIDLTYCGTTNRLKYEFLVRPGADPSQIRLAYRGASSVVLNARGEMEVETPLGGFVDERPTAYQVRGGARTPVAAAFDLAPLPEGDETSYRTSFRLGEYDRSLPLVIDPASLVYAGYLGGAGQEYGAGIAVDGAGSAYVTGYTYSDQASFPVGVGPDLTYNGAGDAFVAKLNPAGTALVYLGYLGGSGSDTGYGIAVDGAGYAYIAGSTLSDQASFPATVGPDLTYNTGSDAFVAKLNPDGTALVYAGYIGGSGPESGVDVALDGAGYAYVTGWTRSNQASFPDGDGFGALPSFDNTFNSSDDVFVAKVNAAGTGLEYAGYIGGWGLDNGNGIAVDGAGNAYLAGSTYSNQASFPDGDGFGALPSFDNTHNGGSSDAFVAKVNAAGSALLYAGYMGGDVDYEGAQDIAVNSAGNAYVVGYTASPQTSFPDGDGFGALPSFDNTHNGGLYDAFVAKLNATGTALDYVGYLGGSSGEYGNSIALDGVGNVYVTGYTGSDQASFPDGDGFGTLTSFDNTFNGETEGFAARLNSAGTGLDYAGYIGGAGIDVGRSIAVDGAGNAYVTGQTNSSPASFPDGDGFGALASFDTSYGGSNDAFVAKISLNTPPVANPNSYTTDEDTPLAVAAPSVLGNDSDADNDPLAAVKESDPISGTLALNADGSLVYTPTLNYNGVVTFTYHASDGAANSNTTVVTLTVNAVNDAPSFTQGTDQAVDEDAWPQTVSGWASAISAGPADEAGQTVTFTVDSNDNAPLFSAGPALASNGSLTYTPASDANGVAHVGLKLVDSGGTARGGVDTSPTRPFTATVNPVNDAPSATDDSVSTAEDTPLTFPAGNLIANDSPGPANESGQALTVSGVSTATHGSVSLNGGDISYTPHADYHGSDSFTYTVCDDGTTRGGPDSRCGVATVDVAVGPVNDEPVAHVDSYSIPEDTPLTVAVPGVLGDDTDADNDPLVAVKDRDPVSGLLALGSDGSLVYTPTLNFNGVVTFTYHAGDGLASSNTAVVTLTVNPVNDAPTLSDIPDQQVEEGDTLGPISFTVGDVDDEVDGLDLGAASSDPALAPVSGVSFGGGGANRSLTLTPTLGLTGTATISITVGDGTDSSSDAFLLTVGPRTRYYFYLPLVFKNHVLLPDVVVNGLVAAGDTLSLTVRNVGAGPVTDAFWVTVYFNPTEMPIVNRSWVLFASHGLLWHVTGPILPGDSLILVNRAGDLYYTPQYSSAPPLPAAASVYALVDSFNYGSDRGALRESDEDNNLFGPALSTGGALRSQAPK